MKRKIYICAPITENIYEDIHQAMKYAEYVLKCGMAPVIPHCYYLCMSKLDEKELETEEFENMTGEKMQKIFPQSATGQAMR